MTDYAVIGHPVAHSLSPALHNHWFERHGIDAHYRAIDLPPDQASTVAARFRDEGLAGANLTVPFKEAIVPAVDCLSALAKATGSVNTIWWADGALHGDTTDALGFVDALCATGPVALHQSAAVLGTGGAGVAVAAGLAQRAVPRVYLLNRSLDRAERAAQRLASAFPECDFIPGSLQELADVAPQVGVVANCVSGGGRDAIRALPIDRFPDELRWCDLNYWDSDPPHAAALGSRFTDGLPMLVHQAAHAFHHWTGIRPDPTDTPKPCRMRPRRSRDG